VAGVSGDGDASRLGGMLILAMAAFLFNQIPAICFNESEDIADFHVEILAEFHLLTSWPFPASSPAHPATPAFLLPLQPGC